jgi:hypothetical protein
MKEYFKKQIECSNANALLFFAVENVETGNVDIRNCTNVETLPTNLKFVRMFTENIPLFMEEK